MHKLLWFALLPALVVFVAPACVPEAAIKDLCTDDAACVSDQDCPAEPPNGGDECEELSGAECFYCAERDRIDASHYACDDDDRWRRLANTDCD